MREASIVGKYQMLRIVYRCALALWFVGLAFWCGPHLILFGKLTGLSASDFIPQAQPHEKVILALKQFRADNGRLPDDLLQLVPEYLPRGWEDTVKGEGFIANERYLVMTGVKGHPYEMTYNLDGRDEHWEVEGPFFRGRLPLSPVPSPVQPDTSNKP